MATSTVDVTAETIARQRFADKRIVILGLARQGLALARFFARAGAQTVISDAADAEKLATELAQLGDLPVELVLGGHPLTLLDGCDLLCLSGGVPPQLEIVQAAIARGIGLSNDSLLTMQLAAACGLGPVVAITGSSGKTTTTTLVGQMLAASGKTVHVGGNIGTPLIDRLDQIVPGDVIVLELSSFQLELFDPLLTSGTLEGIGPDVAAILNVTPNHLDRHPHMAAYAAAKFNLLQSVGTGTRAMPGQVVLSLDDSVTQRLASDEGQPHSIPLPSDWRLEPLLANVKTALTAKGVQLVPFSRQQLLGSGAWVAEDLLIYAGQPICRRAELQLRGEHNVSNLLAAAAISGAVGATIAGMGEVARRFQGVPHRLETVLVQGGVTWINDSIATSPERAVAALRCFAPEQQTLILVAGGKDKNLPWEHFADEVIARVNYLIGFGHAGAMIVEKVQERAHYNKSKAPNCAVVQRLDEAVALAARVSDTAGQPTALPGVVLLSPGGTSYDAYRDFEARGEHFRTLVARWTTPAHAALPGR